MPPNQLSFRRKINGRIEDLFAQESVVFQAQYPDLRIEIVSNVRMANLTRREADIAIRLLRANHGNFVISRIGQMETGIDASSDYLATHPAGLAERGLGHICIGWDDTLQDFPLARWLEQMVPAGKTNFMASSLQSQTEAAVAGPGLIALPLFLAGCPRYPHQTNH